MRTSENRRRCPKGAAILITLAILLAAAAASGGSLSFIKQESGPVSNIMEAGSVDNGISEEFDGRTKKNVNVVNSGTVPAYVRVKLLTYRVNDNGSHIGGAAEIPGFEPGEGWAEYPNDSKCYYYTKPVPPGGAPDKPLIGEAGIKLREYEDEDGGRQVIEVLSENIQAAPAAALCEAWGVTITPPDEANPGKVESIP